MFNWQFGWHEAKYQNGLTRQRHYVKLLFNGCLIKHLGGTLSMPSNDN